MREFFLAPASTVGCKFRERAKVDISWSNVFAFSGSCHFPFPSPDSEQGDVTVEASRLSVYRSHRLSSEQGIIKLVTLI